MTNRGRKISWIEIETHFCTLLQKDQAYLSLIRGRHLLLASQFLLKSLIFWCPLSLLNQLQIQMPTKLSPIQAQCAPSLDLDRLLRAKILRQSSTFHCSCSSSSNQLMSLLLWVLTWTLSPLKIPKLQPWRYRTWSQRLSQLHNHCCS